MSLHVTLWCSWFLPSHLSYSAPVLTISSSKTRLVPGYDASVLQYFLMRRVSRYQEAWRDSGSLQTTCRCLSSYQVFVDSVQEPYIVYPVCKIMFPLPIFQFRFTRVGPLGLDNTRYSQLVAMWDVSSSTSLLYTHYAVIFHSQTPSMSASRTPVWMVEPATTLRMRLPVNVQKNSKGGNVNWVSNFPSH